MRSIIICCCYFGKWTNSNELFLVFVSWKFKNVKSRVMRTPFEVMSSVNLIINVDRRQQQVYDQWTMVPMLMISIIAAKSIWKRRGHEPQASALESHWTGSDYMTVLHGTIHAFAVPGCSLSIPTVGSGVCDLPCSIAGWGRCLHHGLHRGAVCDIKCAG